MLVNPFTDYLQLEKNYSPKTVTAYKADILAFSTFCKTEYGEEDVDEANYAQLRRWIIKLSEENISNRSINRKIASLKAYYTFLLKVQRIHQNPLATHKSLKTPKKAQPPFSEKEMQEALHNLEGNTDFEGVRDKLIIELLYATGIRRKELIHIKTEDISIPQKALKVLGKRNKERLIPLLPSILPSLENYLQLREGVKTNTSGNFLFLLENGKKLYDTFVYRLVHHHLSKVSPKEKKSPHIIRHAFATHLLNNGANLNAVKELLGHASLASTEVYTHNSLMELKKTYKKAHPRSINPIDNDNHV